MKKLIVLLTIIGITSAVVLFPEVYYLKADEGIKAYHQQDTYNLNKVEEIDLQKKLDILTDENSVYVDKTTTSTKDDEEIIAGIINQITDILQIGVDEMEVVKSAMVNGVESIQVINSSSYNVYSVDLNIIRSYSDKCEFTVLFDSNEKKILYVEVLYLLEPKEPFVEEEEPEILNNIKKYYGEFSNWNHECFGYGEVINIGSAQEINFVLRKVNLKMEEDYKGEMEVYNQN